MTFEVFKTSLQAPKPRTVTMLTNVAEKYGMSMTKVKNAYFRGIFNLLEEKGAEPTKEGYEESLSELEADDYRKIWYKLHNGLQAAVKKAGGQKAKDLKEIQDEAKEILKSDLKRLGRRVSTMKRNIKAGALNRYEKGIAIENIEKYETYMVKAKNKESLGHFTQMLRDNPELGSFLFKPKK